MKPLFAEARTALARQVMQQATGFVALTAPWLAIPSDRRMSRVTLAAIATVLAIGVGEAGYLAVEAVHYAVSRVQREGAP